MKIPILNKIKILGVIIFLNFLTGCIGVGIFYPSHSKCEVEAHRRNISFSQKIKNLFASIAPKDNKIDLFDDDKELKSIWEKFQKHDKFSHIEEIIAFSKLLEFIKQKGGLRDISILTIGSEPFFLISQSADKELSAVKKWLKENNNNYQFIFKDNDSISGLDIVCKGRYYKQYEEQMPTKNLVLLTRGTPNKIERINESEEKWIYKTDGFGWVGILPMVIIPIPIGIPVLSNYEYFYFKDDILVKKQIPDTKVLGAWCGYTGIRPDPRFCVAEKL